MSLGGQYRVLGMELFRGLIQILVPDNSAARRPRWLPMDLFTIEDARLPSNWSFRTYAPGSSARDRGFQGRWGYRELVESDEHRDGLEDLVPEALAIFAAQLRAIESDGNG